MSWLNDTLAALRQVVLLDHRVNGLENDMREAQTDIESLDRRLLQLETLILGPTPPDRLRLPR